VFFCRMCIELSLFNLKNRNIIFRQCLIQNIQNFLLFELLRSLLENHQVNEV